MKGLAMKLWREESGWAMVTVVMLSAMMIGVGLATAAIVDRQTRSSARERLNESGFNLAEGALTSQMYILTRQWPGGAGTAYPSSCPSAAQAHLCPDSNALRQSYNTVDYGSAPAWTTEVHDNDQGDTPNFYNDAAPSPFHYDFNGDGKVWVRADATVKGRTRAIVGLVQVQKFNEELPHSALVAGAVATTNNGNKDIICTRLPDDPSGKDCTSSSPLAGPVQLRCEGAEVPGCNGTRDGQIDPDPVEYGYAGLGLTADALNRLRSRAIADGTYWASGCPANPSGAVVFVENGNCSYSNSTPGPCCNTATKPGVFIVNNGRFSMSGNQTFYGVIYAVNAQNAVGCTPACPVSLTGTVSVRGGVHVGGAGAIMAGSSKVNLMFDDFAFGKVESYGAASLVQNKWREIKRRT
jgi:hypothetical protein